VVIHDAAEFASPVVAERLGVPHLTHSFGALVPRDFVHSAGEEVASLWESLGLSPRPFGGSYDHLYLDIYPPALQPTYAGHVPRAQPLRPVAVDAAPGRQLPAHLRDLPSPVVYVTFGTVFNPAIVFAPVIEVARGLDATVIVTVGPDGDPDALGVVPSNVIVERYVPQSLLFDHCDVVVSHAGSGTFLSALARAIPQLCLPQAADQFVNASACERIGAGITIEPAAVTAQGIRDAIERLRTDEHFRRGALTGAEAIHTMPPPDEVANMIEHLVDDNV
ncbi:MAG: glycosyltransferase, partial [Acidimicrobiales bacterium]